MARPINYHDAKALLTDAFAQAERDYAAYPEILDINFAAIDLGLEKWRAPAPGVGIAFPNESVIRATLRLMESRTQAYREVLIGCALARLLDDQIDIRLPYVSQGDLAYNGRTLDEQVINPFLHENEIPSSRGPFLSVFRRSVTFTAETRDGVRDKLGFDALLTCIEHLRMAPPAIVRDYLTFLLVAFVRLRDAANVALLHVQRLSLDQFDSLITALLQVPSGGRMPMFLAVAMFQTISQCFNLNWKIDWQGINVADRASDVGGDITVTAGDEILLSVEVTERPIDRPRVVSTFQTKILRHAIADYLFFFSAAAPAPEARALARQYFGQGHDISFLPVREWLIHSLGTVGPRCRSDFITNFIALLGAQDVPVALKLAWNDQIRQLLAPA